MVISAFETDDLVLDGSVFIHVIYYFGLNDSGCDLEHNSTLLGQMFEGNQLRSHQLRTVSDEPHLVLIPVPPEPQREMYNVTVCDESMASTCRAPL